jgi:hypothetical protein
MTATLEMQDLSAPDAEVRTPAEKLDAARRKLAELQAREKTMTADYGALVVAGTREEVSAFYDARADVRRAISDLGAAIGQLQLDAERAYTQEQRTHAAACAAAATEFDAALAVLLQTMREFDGAGRALYAAANRFGDPRATALYRLVFDRGTISKGLLMDVLESVTRNLGPGQPAPWATPQPSLVTLARSQANISDWED